MVVELDDNKQPHLKNAEVSEIKGIFNSSVRADQQKFEHEQVQKRLKADKEKEEERAKAGTDLFDAALINLQEELQAIKEELEDVREDIADVDDKISRSKIAVNLLDLYDSYEKRLEIVEVQRVQAEVDVKEAREEIEQAQINIDAASTEVERSLAGEGLRQAQLQFEEAQEGLERHQEEQNALHERMYELEEAWRTGDYEPRSMRFEDHEARQKARNELGEEIDRLEKEKKALEEREAELMIEQRDKEIELGLAQKRYEAEQQALASNAEQAGDKTGAVHGQNVPNVTTNLNT